MTINERILRRQNAHWHDPESFFVSTTNQADWWKGISSKAGRQYLAEAIAELHQVYDGAERIVLKEPRVCLLWPLWDEALRKCGYSTRYVFIYRNPVEVAKSLEKRNGFELEKGLRLWLQYNLHALEVHRVGTVAHFLSYEDFLAKPTEMMQSILRSFGEQGSLQSTAAAELLAFLDAERRHQVVSTDDFENSSRVPDLVKDVYRSLREWPTLSRDEQLARTRNWHKAASHESAGSSRTTAPA